MPLETGDFSESATFTVLATGAYRDAALRVRVRETVWSDVETFTVSGGTGAYKNAALRLVLRATTYRDAALRLVVAPSTGTLSLTLPSAISTDVAIRVTPLAPPSGTTAYRDAGLRVVVRAPVYRDVGLRVRVQAAAYRDVALRLVVELPVVGGIPRVLTPLTLNVLDDGTRTLNVLDDGHRILDVLHG